ncbi:hypothetical protein J132_00996 [Termitomyces sp. J132]|nr:hypothetical protein H2248_007160 [Termitomyces sp. 'cryptogamus']KNZ73161.1 hypothetical protein J132_00996 [Termitomyces sp. J132]
MSVCMGLLREMYISTPETDRRVRLRHGKSLISDFGIAKGRATVQNQDKLAYFYLTDDTFKRGQDPNEHQWLYFTILSSMKMIFDVGMFTFNFCLYVNGQPYLENIYSVPFPLMSAPAFYVDTEMVRSTPKLTTTQGVLST